MTDLINHPPHYEANKYICEPCDLSLMLPHPFASACEYMIRAPYKGTEAQDYRKAAWWLQKAIDTPEFWDDDDCLDFWGYSMFEEAKLLAAIYAMNSKSARIGYLFLSDGVPVCASKQTVLHLIAELTDEADRLEGKQNDEPAT